MILPFVILPGCSAHTNLQPSGPGQLNANISVGGPIVAAFGTHLPIPYLTTGVNYGASEWVDLNMNLHLFSLAYRIAGLDFGGTLFFSFEDENSPTIGIQARLLALRSLKPGVTERMRVYPVFSASSTWDTGSGLLYTGTDVTLAGGGPEYDPEAQKVIPSPFGGYRWTLGERWHLYTEIKWHGANIPSGSTAVEYSSIAGYGAITPLISLERRF